MARPKKNQTALNELRALNKRILQCEACPRLIDHCRSVAKEKRAAYRLQPYHGKPVVNFGPADARLLVVGLAPGAHGANRTGRMFTGDRSGDFLFTAMHKAGFANQPTCIDSDDGLQLIDALLTNAAHCAPPGNKPTREELANCEPFFRETIDVLKNLKAMICLGKIAHDAVLRLYKSEGLIQSMAVYPFGHGLEHQIDGNDVLPAVTLIGSYHPSQQNTFTGKLTMPMLVKVFKRAAKLVRSK